MAGWAVAAMLTASLVPLAHGQTTTPAPTGSTATSKTAPRTTATKPATTSTANPASTGTATKPAATTKPAGTTATKPATTTKPAATTATKPATTATKPAVPTATAPAKSPTGSTASKPAAAPKPAVTAPAKPAATASQPSAPPKPAAPPPAAPKPAPPEATPLRDTTPTASALPGAPTPVAAPGLSFRHRHPLVAGFLTGLLGAGLADTLLGDEDPAAAADAPAAPGNVLEPVAQGLATAETAGQLTRLASFGGLVALAVIWYRRRLPARSAPGGVRERSAPGLSAWDDLESPRAEAEPAPLARPDELQAIADEQDFADILLTVQAAWSEGDVMAMRAHITPDMADYFDRRLAQNTDNGIENRVVDVSNVHVERLADWEEDGLHYIKARMRWRALDYVIDLSKLPDESGYIIDGSPEKPVDSEEVWTFVRSPDGAWVLCEVEQGA
jgi:hypothetical protein